jgi:hypothetical protein
VFLTDYDLGDVYFYKTSLPMTADAPLELVGMVKGPIKGRVIKYWKDRNELYIGCAKGKMSVIDISKFSQGPICKLKCLNIPFLTFLDSTRQHSGDITRMILIEKDGTIASAAKDREMKFWYPPENWKKEAAPYNPNPKVVEKEDIALSDSDSDAEKKKKKKDKKAKKDKKKKDKKKSKKKKDKKKKAKKADTSSESEDDELETPLATETTAAETLPTETTEPDEAENLDKAVSSSDSSKSDDDELEDATPAPAEEETTETPAEEAPVDDDAAEEPKEEENTQPDEDKNNVFADDSSDDEKSD